MKKKIKREWGKERKMERKGGCPEGEADQKHALKG